METRTQEKSVTRPLVRNAESAAAQAEVPRPVSGGKRRQENTNEVKIELKFDAGEARSVALAGSFNGWNATRNPFVKDGGCWRITLTLPRGRHEYRFIVDGKWVSDPNARESKANPYGESNSVL